MVMKQTMGVKARNRCRMERSWLLVAAAPPEDMVAKTDKVGREGYRNLVVQSACLHITPKATILKTPGLRENQVDSLCFPTTPRRAFP